MTVDLTRIGLRPKGKGRKIDELPQSYSSKVSIVLDWKQGTELADDRARNIGRGEGALYADWKWDALRKSRITINGRQNRKAGESSVGLEREMMERINLQGTEEKIRE